MFDGTLSRNGSFIKWISVLAFSCALFGFKGGVLEAGEWRQRPLPVRQDDASKPSATPIAPPEKPPKKKVSRAIFAHAAVGGSLYQRQGRSLFLGGGLAWVTEFSSGLFFSPQVTGFGGPRAHLSDDGFVSGFGIISSLSFGYHFRNERAAIGPAVGVGVKWHRLDFVFDDSKDISQSVVSFRGSVSIDGHVLLTSHLALAMRLDLGFLSNPEAFQIAPDNETILCTPWLEGTVFAGFRFFL